MNASRPALLPAISQCESRFQCRRCLEGLDRFPTYFELADQVYVPRSAPLILSDPDARHRALLPGSTTGTIARILLDAQSNFDSQTDHPRRAVRISARSQTRRSAHSARHSVRREKLEFHARAHPGQLDAWLGLCRQGREGGALRAGACHVYVRRHDF